MGSSGVKVSIQGPKARLGSLAEVALASVVPLCQMLETVMQLCLPLTTCVGAPSAA